MEVSLVAFALKPLQQSERLLLISARVGLILPLDKHYKIRRALDYLFHPQKCFDFHFLHIDQCKVNNCAVRKYFVDQIHWNCFKTASSSLSLRRVWNVSHEHLCSTSVFEEHEQSSFCLNIAGCYFIDTSVAQLIDENALSNKTISNLAGFEYEQFTCFSDKLAYDYGLQSGL